MTRKCAAGQPRLGREQAERLPLAGATWMVVEASDDETQAAATFAGRHGSEPEYVVDYQGYLWLGPISGQEE